MDKKPDGCVIFDPFVSPRLFCETLRDHHIASLAIIVDTWSDATWRENRLKLGHFDEIIYLTQDTEKKALNDLIDRYNILCAVYGREGKSISVADKIIQDYFPAFGNEVKTRLARSNKYNMIERCREKGLLVPKQFVVTDKELSQEQKELVTIMLPVIFKPTQASGSESIHFCKTLDEVLIGIREVLGKDAIATGKVNSIIVQEEIKGVEYFVDMTTINGQHLFSSIFQYYKTAYSNTFIYRWVEIMDYHAKDMANCVQYVSNVLDALGFKWGFSHTEFFLTDKGPCLIEANLRLSGVYSIINEIAIQCYGINQVKLLVDYFQGKKPPTDLALKKHAILIMLQAWEPCVLKEFNIKKLEEVASFYKFKPIKQPGTSVGYPKDLGDSIGCVVLINESREELYRDAKHILHLEETGCLF